MLFDKAMLRSTEALIKTVVVGNLTAGGTGKTPHVIWLAGKLSAYRRIAVLSRGYGRKTRGFMWVGAEDNPGLVGDEPLEMKLKLPEIPVAVDTNRLRGISRIAAELTPPPDLVILDDGFQHRRLKPGYAFILSDCSWPADQDKFLPAGLLREPLSSIRRANAVIVTGTQNTEQALDDSRLRKSFKMEEGQPLFFSSFNFKGLSPVNASAESIDPVSADAVLVVAGIARPGSLAEEPVFKAKVKLMAFPDHHDYKAKDIKAILSAFRRMVGENKIIAATGKDAVKLKQFHEIAGVPLFNIEREVVIDDKQSKEIIESILRYV